MGLAMVACAMAGCGAREKETRGETVVVLDTELPLPDVARAARVDVFAEDGTWLTSRDVEAADGLQWPISFGIAAGAVRERRLVRTRVFPTHRFRDYAGATPRELASAAPASPLPRSVEALCAAAPELVVGGEVTLRYGDDVVLAQPEPMGPCARQDGGALLTLGGAAAARVVVSVRGTYTFEVVRSAPVALEAPLFLRRSCADPATQVACGLVREGGPAFVARDLEPGTYTLLATMSTPDQDAELRVRASAPSGMVDAGPPRGRDTDGGGTPGEDVLRSPSPPAPRLVVGGRDETPTSEPRVEVSVDTFAFVDVEPGRLQFARIVATTTCVGKAAELHTAADRRLDVGAIRACVGGSMVPPAAAEVTGASALSARVPEPVRAAPCASTQPDRVCVPGGTFVMGSELFAGVGPHASYPLRIARLATFYVDRDEVSVAAMLETRAAGASLTGLRTGPEVLFSSEADPTGLCTYPHHPEYPVNCVPWSAAREYCLHRGGDLPTEAMWEYMAKKAGRVRETIYPWGDDEASCDRAVHARVIDLMSDGRCEGRSAAGIEPRAASAEDVTPLGIRGLGGSLEEWCRDDFASYEDECWRNAPLDEPSCVLAFAPYKSVRGGSFSHSDTFLASALRDRNARNARGPVMGFRCVYGAP